MNKSSCFRGWECVSIFHFKFSIFFWSKLLNLQHFCSFGVLKSSTRKMKENTIMFIIVVFEMKKMFFTFLKNSANIRKCNGSTKSLRMKIINIWWKSYASLQWCTLNQWKTHGNCYSFPLDISYRHFRIVIHAFCTLPIA